MVVYSHSQLSMYGDCPLKYKLRYRDRIKRDTEGVEAFLGTMVHDTLKKCYDDARVTKTNTVDDLLAYYDKVWDQNWHESIVITKKDLTQDHYRNLGRNLIERYYERYAPFDSDITIATEMRLMFSLDDSDKYRLTGFVDRLSRTKDGVCEVHDYKTSAHLPSQEDADKDRQLALYQLGIHKRWPDIKKIRLIWHYLAFDTELASSRSDQEMSRLVEETKRLIGEIESAEEFLPLETGLCDWCEYPDLCPRRKHFYQVESLPANEYLDEPGVALVNRYVELRQKASHIADETAKVKEAMVEYAKRGNVDVVTGSNNKARITTRELLKFPTKGADSRQKLQQTIRDAGKWMEVSQLDTSSLARVVQNEIVRLE